MEYLARPGQRLIEHLKNVAEYSVKTFEEIDIQDKQILKEISKLIAYFHDFGKYTTYFQEKLQGKSSFSKLSKHSYLSSITLASYLIDNYETEYLILPAFMAVLSHHSNLLSADDEVPRIKADEELEESIKNLDILHYERLNTLFQQFDDILKNFEKIQKEYNALGIELKKEYFSKTKAIETIQNLRKKLLRFEDEDEQVKEDIALKTQLLYSILIDSDKKDAAILPKSERKYIPEVIVEKYTEKLTNTNNRMLETRVTLRKEVLSTIENQPLEKLYGGVITLTAPTGAGKTLTALSAALKLRSRIQKEVGYTPRIIYSLPYISIIEQNLSIIEEILAQLPDYHEYKESYLAAHYYLAELEEISADDQIDYEKYDKMQLFIETWESEIIVTTFWQLLHTIIGYKNRLMKKFYKLSASIVILDEVQTIPAEHWLLVEKFMDLLTRKLHTTFILMTATQPMILEDKSIELNKNFEIMFKKLDRTEIIDLTEYSKKKTFEEIWKEIRCNERKKSVLVICNTITDSIEKYRIISSEEQEVMYLSTNITPKDRLVRIQQIKTKLKEQQPLVLVSTQVVEAGVDLDFDVVVRELGPIHSIIQIAGRCNRNGNKERSKMYLINTKEDSAKKVYGATLIEVAKEVIKQYKQQGIIIEKNYIDLTRCYFNLVRDRATKSRESQEFWESFLELKFQAKDGEKSLSEYTLIKDEPKVSIFVSKEPEDEEIFLKFKEILSENDKEKRAGMCTLYKRKIEERMIHINVSRALKNLPPAIENYEKLRFINKESLEAYYDLNTGFKYIDNELKEQVIW
ncbi:MAG: CRISPR-associated helicase Cas3' [Fervidobacterium sp.]|nr:CRISPR-associated helicase Cas3' [Fervidobacterium sp.]